MSHAKPLITVGALASRSPLVETRDVSSLDMRRGVVVDRAGEPLPTLAGEAAYSRWDSAAATRRAKSDEPSAPIPTIRPFLAADSRGDLTHPTEASMPRGVYPRKPKAKKADDAAAPEKPAKKRRPPRRAAPAASSSRHGAPRFGVFEDGSVSIDTEHCKGQLGTDDFRELVAFAKRIGIAV